MPVHNRQVTGNRDLTTAGGTKTISEGEGTHEDSETVKKKNGEACRVQLDGDMVEASFYKTKP